MNKGAAILIACIFLAWFFSSAPKQPEPIPTDGLIEAVASVKELMSPNHISDDGKKVELSGNSGKLNSSESPNSSPSPSDRHEKAKREIVIFTRPNCPPCDRWKRCEQAKFEAEGWTVAYCDDHNYPLTPTFLIDAANKQTEHRGYLPFEKLKEVFK